MTKVLAPMGDGAPAGPRAGWQAQFFSTSTQPLMGFYGPPYGPQDRGEAILLCAPPGHEGQRTQWSFRLLGEQLRAAGFHVLRFDFSGTGDSWGTFEQADLARWTDDAAAARQELSDLAGISRVSALGLRLGASLAWLARDQADWHRLLLWDPVVDGKAYLAQLRALNTQANPGAPADELLGYRYSEPLLAQLAGLSMASPMEARNTLMLVPGATGSKEGSTAASTPSGGEPMDWDQPMNAFEPILLPHARQQLVDLLVQGDR